LLLDCISAFTIVKLKKPYAAFLITIGITGRNKELFSEDINQHEKLPYVIQK